MLIVKTATVYFYDSQRTGGLKESHILEMIDKKQIGRDKLLLLNWKIENENFTYKSQS
mgnify:FL=1